jgi:hypothetical protein
MNNTSRITTFYNCEPKINHFSLFIGRFFIIIFLASCANFNLLYSQERYSSQIGIVKDLDIALPFHAKNNKLKFEVIDGKVILEGDMIVDYLHKAVAIVGNNFRWSNNTIPFVIAPNHPAVNNINWAISHINQNTNLRLAARTNENDFVTFVSGTGCSSWVGRRGGNQEITIGNCSRGSIAHEILHAAGMFHEQSREDRNTFIRVNTNNIEQGRGHNFQQHIADGVDIGSYDYGSIMHYPADAFSTNGQNTIVVLSPPAPRGTIIGQRVALSQDDINAVNQLYPKQIIPKPKPSCDELRKEIANQEKELDERNIDINTRKAMLKAIGRLKTQLKQQCK